MKSDLRFDGEWRDWSPWLFADEATVERILDTLPKTPVRIPWLVKLIENPKSPFHVAGPTTLDVHDVLHVLLGRGLTNQDEAFVVGFSIGNARKGSAESLLLFEVVGRLYPQPFRFTRDDIKAAEIGFDFGQSQAVRDLHRMDSRFARQLTVKQLREHFGINSLGLLKAFELECKAIPASRTSKRLVAVCQSQRHFSR